MLSLEFEIFMYFLKIYFIFGLVQAKKNAVSTPKKVFSPCIFKVSRLCDTIMSLWYLTLLEKMKPRKKI